MCDRTESCQSAPVDICSKTLLAYSLLDYKISVTAPHSKRYTLKGGCDVRSLPFSIFDVPVRTVLCDEGFVAAVAHQNVTRRVPYV